MSSIILNVLSNKARRVCCIRPAKDGLSDILFDQGVRVFYQGLATEAHQRAFNSGMQVMTPEDFQAHLDPSSTNVEPGRAWKGKYFNPYDNINDQRKIY